MGTEEPGLAAVIVRGNSPQARLARALQAVLDTHTELNDAQKDAVLVDLFIARIRRYVDWPGAMVKIVKERAKVLSVVVEDLVPGGEG